MRVHEMDFHRRVLARNRVLAGRVEVKLSERDDGSADIDGTSGGRAHLEGVAVVQDRDARYRKADSDRRQVCLDAVPQIDGRLLVPRPASAECGVETCPPLRAVFTVVPLLSRGLTGANRTGQETEKKFRRFIIKRESFLSVRRHPEEKFEMCFRRRARRPPILLSPGQGRLLPHRASGPGRRDRNDRISDSFVRRATKDFVTQLLLNNQSRIYACARGHAQKNIDVDAFKDLEIPLPPLEIQKEIVAEIAGYQKVIEGARTVVAHYRPHIPIQTDWPIIKLSEICSFKNGLNFTRGASGYTVKIIGVGDFRANLYAPLADLNEVQLDAPLGEEYLVKAGDILFVRSNGNPDLVGRSLIIPALDEPITFSGFTIRGRIEDARALPIFFAHFFKSRDFAEMIKTVGQGANIRNLSQGILNELDVPLPPIGKQRAIVAELEAEHALVGANRELIARFQKKIKYTLARVWGDETMPVVAEEPVATEA